MQKGHNESSLAYQYRDTVLECRFIVGDVHEDHVRNDRIKGLRGRRPDREISLHVLNPQLVPLFSAEGVSDQGLCWLNSCHARAFSGQEPTEIALTTSCIENAFASHLSKERENGWVQKILTDQIPFLAEAFDEVLRIMVPGGMYVCIGRLSHDVLRLAYSCDLFVASISHEDQARAKPQE